jgi:glutathione S-transferase
MLRIYGSAKSRTLRTLWLVGELGIPYEHKVYLPHAPETQTPEFQALNANKRIPTIDDDGFVLSESMAINFYLAKTNGSPLYPPDPQNEARALQWTFWQADRIDKQVVNYSLHSKALPEAERKKEIADASWKELSEALDVLETALAKSQWLSGPQFSLGDLNVAAALYRALFIDLSKWPHVQAWLTRCWERPAAKRVRAMRE